MALYRERGAPRFSEEDATLIRLLHPHLSRALQARSALDAIRPDGPRTVADVTRHAAGHAFLGRREVEWAAAGRELFESAFDGRLGAVERSLLEARDAWHAEGAPRSFRLGPMRVELAELPRRTLALFYREAAPRFGRRPGCSRRRSCGWRRS